MSLDPSITALLTLMKARIARGQYVPFRQLQPAEARIAFDEASLQIDVALPELAYEREYSVPVRAGGRIAAKLYPPRELSADAPMPVMMYLHGGGFVMGSLKSHASLCRSFVARAQCGVLALTYRLAPEHRFPTAFNDAVDALAWIGQEGSALGFDIGQIAVAGDSTGATLAAAVAIAARDDSSLPQPVLQLLISPTVSSKLDFNSCVRYGQGYLLEIKDLVWFFDQNSPDPAVRQDWRFAPMECSDLSGVASALFVSPGYDPMLDESTLMPTSCGKLAYLLSSASIRL